MLHLRLLVLQCAIAAAAVTASVGCAQEEDAALLLQWRPQLLQALLQHAQHFRASVLAASLLQLQTQQQQQQQQNVVEQVLRQLIEWLQQQHCSGLESDQHTELEALQQQQQQQQQEEAPAIPLPVLLDVSCGFVDAFLPVRVEGLGFRV